MPSPGSGAGEEEMRPLVSVVCACFNISKYLDEAIASIYAQGYPNLELIVVDDGSTDDTYERLAMLRERHGFQTKWRETVSARGVWSVGGSMQHWPRPWWSCR